MYSIGNVWKSRKVKDSFQNWINFFLIFHQQVYCLKCMYLPLIELWNTLLKTVSIVEVLFTRNQILIVSLSCLWFVLPITPRGWHWCTIQNVISRKWSFCGDSKIVFYDTQMVVNKYIFNITITDIFLRFITIVYSVCNSVKMRNVK